MRYPITLPADYDMGIIRERVRTRGHLLDDRDGLTFKAYCVREVGVDGSPVNQYAPFYLWSDGAAAAGFLWRGQGFDGIVRDFGRPVVHTWTPAAVWAGDADRAEVTRAELRTWSIDPDADLVEVAEQATNRARARSMQSGVYVAVAGIDPTTWQVVEFATTAQDAARPSGGAVALTVLHVSQPEALR